MRIFWAFCIYNEIELLPFKIDYMRKNGISFYIFDNMSTDGSWEWLQKNQIPSERFDSDGMFDLKVNLALVIRKIHKERPDWAMMAGADIFYAHPAKTLREVVESADRVGFNLIDSGPGRLFHFLFTGNERPGKDPRLTYMYYTLGPWYTVSIGKYDASLAFSNADVLKNDRPRIHRDEDFTILHYSMRHDCRQRKTELFNRRKRAWDCGHVAKCYGSHYQAIVNAGQFVFDKSSLSDIRNTRLWPRIKEECDGVPSIRTDMA